MSSLYQSITVIDVMVGAYLALKCVAERDCSLTKAMLRFPGGKVGKRLCETQFGVTKDKYIGCSSFVRNSMFCVKQSSKILHSQCALLCDFQSPILSPSTLSDSRIVLRMVGSCQYS